MKKQLIIMFALALLLFPSVSAENLGTFKQNSEVTLYQHCDSCSYVKLTSVKLPNSQIINISTNMSKYEEDYTYNFSDTESLGEYFYTVCGDTSDGYLCETINFYIDKTGRRSNDVWLSFAIVFLLLFFNLLVIYKKNKMIGGIIFFIIGISILFIEPIISYAGLIIALSSIGLIVFDLLPSTSGVNSGKWIKRR